MLHHNNKACCLWVALFVVASVVSAHKAPFDSDGDEDSPEVDGVEHDLDNTWLLDQSFLIFCMY